MAEKLDSQSLARREKLDIEPVGVSMVRLDRPEVADGFDSTAAAPMKSASRCSSSLLSLLPM